MDSENAVVANVRRFYEKDIEELSSYIPYFKDKGKKDVQKTYEGEQGESNLLFPVFDGTLMRFVKRAQASRLMDKNYPYVYSRYRIRTHDDERRLIENATIRDVDTLRGIFSKYILEGQRKATRWGEGVEERIYLNVLSKLKEMLDFYR